MNASASRPEHHLQWRIRPAASGLEQAYDRLHVLALEKQNRWRLIASPEGRNGSLVVAQDVRVLATVVDSAMVAYRQNAGRLTSLHVVAGARPINGNALTVGDAAFAKRETELALTTVPGAAG